MEEVWATETEEEVSEPSGVEQRKRSAFNPVVSYGHSVDANMGTYLPLPSGAAVGVGTSLRLRC